MFNRKKKIHIKDIYLRKSLLIDDLGFVFYFKNKVLRAVTSEEYAKLYIDLLKENWFQELYEIGLVDTKISSDYIMDGVPLVLEHKKYPFFLHPCEFTSEMHWMAAKKILEISAKLLEHGLMLKDCHPWNIMFSKGYPKFIDFTSIIKFSQFSIEWFNEFKKYFLVPIYLSHKGLFELSREYRREHIVGFGLKAFEDGVIETDLPKISDVSIKNTAGFLTKINNWLDSHKPEDPTPGKWSGYEQNKEDPENPVSIKSKFVYKILKKYKPQKVLDCAGNNGFFSEMAANFGASALSFDYEERCVDECLKLTQRKQLDITPAILDFRLPTPNYNIGLLGESSFERFRSNIVIATGLIHHICITQNIPVKIFCEICMKYADDGVILEYVDYDDIHVKQWNPVQRDDYRLENVIKIFSVKFPKHQIETYKEEISLGNGVSGYTHRQYIFFHK